MPSLGDPLRAAQVEIDGVTPVRDVLRGIQEVLLVVGAELDDERAVVRGDAFDRVGREVERFLPAFGLGRERGGVEHGRVAQVGAVYAREDPPGLRVGRVSKSSFGTVGDVHPGPYQLGLVDHRCDDVFRFAYRFPQLVPLQLALVSSRLRFEFVQSRRTFILDRRGVGRRRC